MKNLSWANYIKDQRKACGLTRRKLAEMSGIDPSYVTLIERDGYVPRKDKVEAISQALGANVDQTLLVAGYAPQQIPMGTILNTLENAKADGEAELEPELKACVAELYQLNEEQQRKVAEVLGSYVRTLKEKERSSVHIGVRRGLAQ